MSEEPKDDETGYFSIPYPNHYSNASAIGSTFMEVAVTFYEQIDQEHATVKARIAMPPAHAKLLARLLSGHIEFWEKKWGEVHIPDELLRRAGMATEKKEPKAEPPEA